MVAHAGPRYPKPHITDDEAQWLEDAKAPDVERTPCCAKCRRGTRAHGTLPCGYILACPNGCHG